MKNSLVAPLGDLPSVVPSGDRALDELKGVESEVHIPPYLLFDLLDENIGNFGEATRVELARFEKALQTGGAHEVWETLEAYIRNALGDVYNEDRRFVHRGTQPGHRPTFMSFAVKAAYLVPLDAAIENQRSKPGGVVSPVLSKRLGPLVQSDENGEIPLGIMISQAVRGNRKGLEKFLLRFDDLLAASDPRLAGFTMRALVDDVETAQPVTGEPNTVDLGLVVAKAPRHPISHVLLEAFDRFDKIQEARKLRNEQRDVEAWERARSGW